MFAASWIDYNGLYLPYCYCVSFKLLFEKKLVWKVRHERGLGHGRKKKFTHDSVNLQWFPLLEKYSAISYTKFWWVLIKTQYLGLVLNTC